MAIPLGLLAAAAVGKAGYGLYTSEDARRRANEAHAANLQTQGLQNEALAQTARERSLAGYLDATREGGPRAEGVRGLLHTDPYLRSFRDDVGIVDSVAVTDELAKQVERGQVNYRGIDFMVPPGSRANPGDIIFFGPGAQQKDPNTGAIVEGYEQPIIKSSHKT